MSNSFSISSLFGGGTAAPAETPAETPAQPGNLPAAPNVNSQASPGTAANGVVPAQPAATDTNVSPLDQFKDLWDPINKEGDSSNTPVALDPAKVSEAMGKADFSNLITQENLAAISQGGEGAAKAFVDTINAVSRQSMTQSTLIADKMLEQAISKMEAKQQTSLQEQLKKHSLGEKLTTSNPVFSDPAIKPVIEAVQSQLAAKYPSASAAELATMAQNFVTTMASSLSPKTEESVDSSSPKEVDWTKFLEQ